MKVQSVVVRAEHRELRPEEVEQRYAAGVLHISEVSEICDPEGNLSLIRFFADWRLG